MQDSTRCAARWRFVPSPCAPSPGGAVTATPGAHSASICGMLPVARRPPRPGGWGAGHLRRIRPVPLARQGTEGGASAMEPRCRKASTECSDNFNKFHIASKWFEDVSGHVSTLLAVLDRTQDA